MNTIHPTTMYKCILETPQAVATCLQEQPYAMAVAAGEEISRRSMKRAYLFGCGTSHHAAMAGASAFNELAGVDADAYQSFELQKYRLGGHMGSIAGLAYSHSGRTKATCEAASLVRRAGALTVAVTDIVRSPLHRMGQFLVESGSGVEPVNPKTRSFATAVVLGNIMAAAAGNDQSALSELREIPGLLQNCLALEDQMRDIAAKTVHCASVTVVGGGPNLATAMEIALKFKECVPMLAEGLEVEDAMHGPLRPLGKDSLVIGLSAEGPSYDKVGQFLTAATLMGCPVVSITGTPHDIPGVLTVKVPSDGIREMFTVSLLALPAYLLVYHATLLRGDNPDCPQKHVEDFDKAMAAIPRVAY